MFLALPWMQRIVWISEEDDKKKKKKKSKEKDLFFLKLKAKEKILVFKVLENGPNQWWHIISETSSEPNIFRDLIKKNKKLKKEKKKGKNMKRKEKRKIFFWN